MNSKSHTLTRTGHAQLTFQGDLLAKSDGHWFASVEQNRWHNIAIYQTEGGTFVVHVEYNTCWQGEAGASMVDTCAAPAGVEDILLSVDPTALVQGFPTGEAYAEKQDRLMTGLRQRYAMQVSEVLAGELFAETVE